MKFGLNIVIITLGVTTIVCTAQTAVPVDVEPSKMDAIVARVKNGDKTAIMEVANIRAEIAVPALSKAAQNKSTDPEKARLARLALGQVKGAEDFVKAKIEEQSGKVTADAALARGQQMKVLALIGSKKAVCTIAGYLFDDKNPGYAGSDMRISSPSEMATIVLHTMDLPEAPSLKYPSSAQRVAAWREWWMKNKSQYEDVSPDRK